MEIRPATLDDAPAIQEIYTPYVRDTLISLEWTIPDSAEIRRRMTATIDTYPWLVARTDEQIIGYAYAGPHRVRTGYSWTAEVSIYLRQGHHRHGWGRQLYAALEDILFRQGVRILLAGISLPNPVSTAFHQACGFSHLGTYHGTGYKFGQWVDVAWWEKCRPDPLSDPPSPLIPWRVFRGEE